MSEEQRPIAIDEKYEVRDNQFWYNDCSFRDLIENKAAIVVNIEGLGIRTLEHTKTPLSYHISPNDQMWWREHKYRHIRVELLEIKEKIEPLVTKEKFESIKEISHSPICIERENEFYQGYIRFKISVTNRDPYVINDITLDFIFDDNILYISKYDNCTVKNNKFILGNIYGGKSKSITIYFEPLTCSKATDIKCQVTYADHEGNMNSVFMKPKEISIVCPILETEQNINIGRLKEFIEKLLCKDSRVYHIQSGFDVEKLYNLSREVIERRDVKHISTLHSRDGKNYEVWYYGKTKVKEYDIVIKVAIYDEQQVLELFASTRSAEALTGLLAEMGRDLKQSVESNISGKNNVINVHIKDSVVQHCNLLDLCDTNGTCGIDVVIENSVIQDTTIADKRDNKDNVMKKLEQKLENGEIQNPHDSAIDIINQESKLKVEEGLKIEREKVEMEKSTPTFPIRQELKPRESKIGWKLLLISIVTISIIGGYWTLSSLSPATEFTSIGDQNTVEVTSEGTLSSTEWNNKGLDLFVAGRAEEALEAYDKATEIDPQNVYAWYNKGIAYSYLGRYEEALQAYNRTTEIGPEDAYAWYNKGTILDKLGRTDEAQVCYDKAKEQGY